MLIWHILRMWTQSHCRVPKMTRSPFWHCVYWLRLTVGYCRCTCAIRELAQLGLRQCTTLQWDQSVNNRQLQSSCYDVRISFDVDKHCCCCRWWWWWWWNCCDWRQQPTDINLTWLTSSWRHSHSSSSSLHVSQSMCFFASVDDDR